MRPRSWSPCRPPSARSSPRSLRREVDRRRRRRRPAPPPSGPPSRPLADAADAVLVHDAARPLTPPEVVAPRARPRWPRRPAPSCRCCRSSTPSVVVDDDGASLADAGPRAPLRRVQTPQGFDRPRWSRPTPADDGAELTDDAAVVARAGVPVQTVAGRRAGRQDHGRARSARWPSCRCARDRPAAGRARHRRPSDRAGPRLPAGRSASGRAPTAAPGTPTATSWRTRSATRCCPRPGSATSAALFGTDDPRWAGAQRRRRARARRGRCWPTAGWRVGNVAVQVIGNRAEDRARAGPRRRRCCRQRSARRSSVSATTTDGLGLTGRGEGLAAIATALVVAAEAGRVPVGLPRDVSLRLLRHRTTPVPCATSSRCAPGTRPIYLCGAHRAGRAAHRPRPLRRGLRRAAALADRARATTSRSSATSPTSTTRSWPRPPSAGPAVVGEVAYADERELDAALRRARRAAADVRAARDRARPGDGRADRAADRARATPTPPRTAPATSTSTCARWPAYGELTRQKHRRHGARARTPTRAASATRATSRCGRAARRRRAGDRVLADAVGPRPARLAHRVLGDGARKYLGAGVRHPRRRRRPALPAPRERAGPVARGRRRVRAVLDAQRAGSPSAARR